jgi:hypothetical protein
MKVISGGQTGVDQGALEAAKEAGLETGGHMPLGFLTEAGKKPRLAKKFAMEQMHTEAYPVRTDMNCRNAHATVWIGKVGSNGYKCTKRCAHGNSNMWLEVMPDQDDAADLICLFIAEAEVMAAKQTRHGLILNVAGNRESKNPGLQAQTRALLLPVFRALRDD